MNTPLSFEALLRVVFPSSIVSAPFLVTYRSLGMILCGLSSVSSMPHNFTGCDHCANGLFCVEVTTYFYHSFPVETFVDAFVWHLLL